MRHITLGCFILCTTMAGCTVDTDSGGDADTTADAETTAAAGTMAVMDTSGVATFDTSASAGGRAAAPVRGEDARLYPVDEASEDPTLASFRLRMLEAVAARDTTFLLDHVDEGIRINFGADRGKDAFREMWNPAQPNSEIWTILAGILGGGGVMTQEESRTGSGELASAMFQAPYYYAAFPGDEFDAFQHGVIIDAGVPVREEPSASAAAIDTLSFDIVPVPNFTPYEADGDEWVRVALGEGRFGYVPEAVIRSPVGYRAVFHKIDGRWTMTALVAGD